VGEDERGRKRREGEENDKMGWARPLPFPKFVDLPL